MNGLNPVYVASQLGHSLVILMKRYAKWINSDKNKEEIAKISNSAKIVPKKKGIKLCIWFPFIYLAEAVLVKLNNQTTDKYTKNNLILVFYCYFYYNKISTNHLFIFHSPDTILA